MANRALALALLGGTFGVTSGLLALGLDMTGDASAQVGDVFDGLTAVSFAAAGAALAWVRPRNAIGWVLLVIGVCEGLADLGSAVAQHPSVQPGALQTGAAWLASWVWFPALGLLPTVVLALYPTGHAGSRPRRLLVAAATAGTVSLMASFALVRDAADDIVPGVVNPVAVHPLGIALAILGGVLLVPSVLLTVVDAARRLWRSSSPEREQLAWLFATVVLTVLISYTPWQQVRAGVYLLVPIAIVIGVVRHRLLDLQVVVRRALLFVGLTGLVVAVFAGTTAALSGLVQGDGVPVAVSAGLVALLLTPARDRIQRGVDRLVYGDRRDPVRAVAGVGRDVALHDVTTLVPQVLSTVMTAVRSPHVVLRNVDGAPLAEAGTPAAGVPLHLPLRVGGQEIGALDVAPRTPREGWSRADLALLDVLAPQVAVVVHASQLYVDLVESRNRVLGAASQERERLRAELHDGLGPALSGIALGLEAAEASLDTSPTRAAALVGHLREATQAAGREVRRLVDGLHPVALEGRSLPEAVGSLLDGLSAGGLAVELVVSAPLPEVAADVDAAAYRIIAEAVTNVVRHSGASWCRVRLEVCGGSLSILVEDDGHGLPTQPSTGVGLASMRRRAADVGGSWSLAAREGGGTRVDALLPVVAGAAVHA